MSSGSVFINEFFILYGGEGFSVLRKPFSLLQYFFLQVETITEIRGSKFIWERLFSARKRFFTQWKLFSFIPSFFPASENRY